jgi:hypothetical protein
LSIPELNVEQVTLLTNMASGLGAFSQVVPDSKLDKASDYEAIIESVRDNEQLVILGLIKELTDEPSTKEKIVTLFSMTGRMFRVFEITDIARKLFDGVERTIQ